MGGMGSSLPKKNSYVKKVLDINGTPGSGCRGGHVVLTMVVDGPE